MTAGRIESDVVLDANRQGTVTLDAGTVSQNANIKADNQSTAAMTGIPNGNLAVAALNAAKDGTVRNAVDAANEKKKKQ